MLAHIADLRLCALMFFRPYVLAPLCQVLPCIILELGYLWNSMVKKDEVDIVLIQYDCLNFRYHH